MVLAMVFCISVNRSDHFPCAAMSIPARLDATIAGDFSQHGVLAECPNPIVDRNRVHEPPNVINPDHDVDRPIDRPFNPYRNNSKTESGT